MERRSRTLSRPFRPPCAYSLATALVTRCVTHVQSATL